MIRLTQTDGLPVLVEETDIVFATQGTDCAYIHLGRDRNSVLEVQETVDEIEKIIRGNNNVYDRLYDLQEALKPLRGYYDGLDDDSELADVAMELKAQDTYSGRVALGEALDNLCTLWFEELESNG